MSMDEEQKNQIQQVVPQPSQNPKDVEDNKILAAIGYLGILCLVPLLLKKDSVYAQFHGKQGLVLLIAWVVVNVVAIVPFVGWIAAFFGNILCLAFMVVGIVNSMQGKMKELPIVGEYAKKINL
jgi:uncharacterized membrane protein